MRDDNKTLDEELTPEALDALKEKMCGTLKPRRLSPEEISQLKRRGRI